MRVNVKNFVKLLQKVTINYSLDTLHLKVGPARIKSSMVSGDSLNVVILDIVNDIFMDVPSNEELDIYLNDPLKVLPFITLLDEEEVDFEFKEFEGKFILKNGNQQSSIYMCTPEVVNVFSSTRLIDNETPLIASFELDDIYQYIKRSKACASYGKIYFGVLNGVFYMEITDRTSGGFVNSIKFDLTDVNSENVDLCFKFKSLVNVCSVIEDMRDFKIDFFKKMSSVGIAIGLIRITTKDHIDSKEVYHAISFLDS